MRRSLLTARISDMELNELLEELLNEEFSDISIYTGEAELFANKLVGGHRIAETFTAFAREETQHALALMKMAGKTGEVKVRRIEAGTSLRKCLEMHARREAVSVTIYTRLREMLSSPEHKLTVRGIIAQETEHLRAARDYLMKLRAAYGE